MSKEIIEFNAKDKKIAEAKERDKKAAAVFKGKTKQEGADARPKAKKDHTKVGAVIILIISALVFLPFGASAIFESLANRGNRVSFGSYDGQEIVYEPGSRFYNAASNIASLYQNAGIEINEYSIMNQAFNETVTSMMFNDEVNKAGYEVPGEAINRTIVYNFTDPETGTFSQRLYNQASDAEISLARNDAEDYLIYDRYRSDLFGTTDQTFNSKSLYGLKRSQSEKDFLSGMGSEKHSFDAALFDLNALPAEEIIRYGNDNAERFTQYDLSIITVDDEETATSLLRQINANEITFDDAAAENSQTYYSTTDNKTAGTHRFQLENILDDTADFQTIDALQAGEISPVIKTRRGYSILRCDGESSPADFENSDIQETVHYYIDSNEKSYVENYFINRAQLFISQTATDSFDAACEAYGIEKTTVNAFPVNFGSSDIYAHATGLGELEELTADVDNYIKAFSLNVNEVSEPIVLDSNVVVLKCTGIQNDETESASETEITNADSTAASQTLFASDKVENNFLTTYYQLLLQSRQ